jgi:hypothetical protein
MKLLKSTLLSQLAYMLIFASIVVLLVYYTQKYISSYLNSQEAFQNPDPSQDFRSQANYKRQLASIQTHFKGVSGRRKGFEADSPQGSVPEDERCLVNYYALGCRITGYLGPFMNGYLEPAEAVAIASQAGCRVFVLDIDYMGSAKNAYPRIVVRDRQNKSVAEAVSNGAEYQNDKTSNIRQVADAIAINAIQSALPQSSDPIILVLNFLRLPGSKKSSETLDFYSAVARNLEPLYQYMLHNESTGTYNRQSQEGRLLTNPISTYSGKVLVFSNADTSGFREAPSGKYTAKQDLDYLVNLRLYYNQSKIGVTESPQGQVFGLLEKVGDYQIIPADRRDQIVERMKLQWTIVLPNDPAVSPTKEEFEKARSFGVNCIPVAIWDETIGTGEDYTFDVRKGAFPVFSFVAKPAELRFKKPRAIVPPTPSQQLDAKGGSLRQPV